jgi:hypothetical protein
MLELLWLLVTTALAWMRPRQDLAREHLLLCHQFAVLTRPTRARPRPGLRARDKLLWAPGRRFWSSRGRRQRVRPVRSSTRAVPMRAQLTD